MAVKAGKPGRRRAQRIGKSDPPHQEDRTDNAALLPAPARGDGPGRQTKRFAGALELAGECNIFH